MYSDRGGPYFLSDCSRYINSGVEDDVYTKQSSEQMFYAPR